MIAPRFLSRAEWESRLRYYKCKKVTGLGRLNTGEWWRARWNFLFTIPIEDDGRCHEGEFQKLIIDLINSAPPGTRFDE
jgi:hypothetical protein